MFRAAKDKGKMAPASKADKKAVGDVAAWTFNVVTSVGIIIVNKALMANYGFFFGKFLRDSQSISQNSIPFVLRFKIHWLDLLF